MFNSFAEQLHLKPQPSMEADHQHHHPLQTARIVHNDNTATMAKASSASLLRSSLFEMGDIQRNAWQQYGPTIPRLDALATTIQQWKLQPIETTLCDLANLKASSPVIAKAYKQGFIEHTDHIQTMEYIYFYVSLQSYFHELEKEKNGKINTNETFELQEKQHERIICNTGT